MSDYGKVKLDKKKAKGFMSGLFGSDDSEEDKKEDKGPKSTASAFTKSISKLRKKGYGG